MWWAALRRWPSPKLAARLLQAAGSGMGFGWLQMACSHRQVPCIIPFAWLPCRLHGYKWFTSAADGQVGMALAREQPSAGGSASSGGRGLTLFLVPVTRDEQGRPQVGLQSGRGAVVPPVALLLLYCLPTCPASPASTSRSAC